jgi:4'-phosphopantetheinyl transferase
MTVVEVAPRVWVASRAQSVPDHPHHADALAAVNLPRWRAAELIAGRALLRDLLAEVLPHASAAALVPGANGKPGLAGWPELGVNISHDGGIVAASVAAGRAVGIDVQLPDATTRDALVARCARRHTVQLFALPTAERAVELAWIWTAQEACVKAQGTGLSGCPWSIDVPPGSTSGSWRGLRWRSLRESSPIPLSCAWKETP